MAGARNDILFGGGLDLSGNSTVANRLDTDGFIYFGSGSTNPVAALPTSVNDTVTFHPSAGGLGFEDRRWLTAFVVDPSADVGERGTYQTITEANAAASSGDVVYIRSGTYTEDWTAKAGISYVGDTNKNATTLLTGKVTLSETGVCFFKNLAFASNADNVILHSGANDVEGYFENCYFETDDAVAIISSTNTNSSSVLEFKTCNFLVNNATATYVAHSGTAELRFFYCEMRSSDTWAVNNLLSSSTGGFSIFYWCYIQGSFTTSNNHEFRFHFTELNPQTNTVILTHNSTAGSRDKEVYHCIMRAATTTSTAISIGASATLDLVSTTIESQNATTISGTGTLRYADLVFTNTQVIDAGLTLVNWTTRTGDIELSTGATINEFSTDGTLAGNSDTAVPTEKAVKTYVDSQSGGGGGDKVFYYKATDFDALETNFAPLVQDNGTTAKVMVRAFDQTTEEYVNFSLTVPSEIDTAGTVTFRVWMYASTAVASRSVALTFGHRAIDNSESWDGAYTDEDSGDIAIDATQDDITEATWTETVSNLGWAANDIVLCRLSRYAPSGTNLASDLYVLGFAVEIPRA